MPRFMEVSTVNASREYADRYDSAIHAEGCRDCATAVTRGGCSTYQLGEHANADAAARAVSAEYAEDFGEDHGFCIVVMPCAKVAQ